MFHEKKQVRTNFYICFFRLFLFLFAGILCYSGKALLACPDTFADASPEECLLFWNAELTREDAKEHLSQYGTQLRLLEHYGDFSVCSLNSFDSRFLRKKLLATLNEDSLIRLAEPNYSMELMDTLFPEDPYFDGQWALFNPGSYPHYYGSVSVPQFGISGMDLNLLNAWEEYKAVCPSPRPVIVAVIDTGVDYRHPDLIDHMWVNPGELAENGVDDDKNGYIDDIHGWDFFHNDASVCHYLETSDGLSVLPDDNDNHGTHCAGIIAATANNGIGIAGVASNIDIRIMALKIHGGNSSTGSVANAIKAIRYAESMGASICNLSWGTPNYSRALELAIQDSSMLFVAAAGNEGANNNSTPVYPASFQLSNVISVAFVDSYGNLASNSNYGTSTVDLAAPGQSIYSTLVGSYGYSSGSSMAAPHVSGLAALVYAYREDVYPAQVKELIINTMKPLPSLNAYLKHPGIPDAHSMVRSLNDITADTQAPVLSIQTGYANDMIELTLSVLDAGGSGIRRLRYAYGTKNLVYFQEEQGGTSITGQSLFLTKSGFYTFYAEDYAGNYTLRTYYVEDDTTAPTLNASYEISAGLMSVVISAQAADEKSGLKSFKYLPGEHTKEAFLSDGIELPVSPASITLEYAVGTDCVITFYAQDYRGNSSVVTVYPKIIPAVSLHLSTTERILFVTEQFYLRALTLPVNTTDSVTFISLNPEHALVDEHGMITALSPGDAHIAVITSNGLLATCHIIIPQPVPPTAQLSYPVPPTAQPQ